MEFWHQLFLFALLLPLVSCEDPIYLRCEQNYTNDNLKANIDKTIFTLVAQTPSTGYAISTINTDPNTVYGLAQCRGDISPQDCSNCITSAAKEYQERCRNSASLEIWNSLCQLRIGNTIFFGKMVISDMMGWGLNEEEGIPKEFDSEKWQLLNWVKVRAASSNNRFAMGKRSVSSLNIIIYGMAQCTRDLQELTCMECLEALSNRIRPVCLRRKGCVERTSSCELRQDNYAFSTADFPEQPENDVAYAPAPSALA